MSNELIYDLSYDPPGSFVLIRAASAPEWQTFGTLLEGMPQESNALESLILALACNGFPVDTNEFRDAVTTACDALVNYVDEDGDTTDSSVLQPCPCGSGRESHELYDARGIYCCRVCSACEEQKRRKYRADIFTNPQYECDEQIDDDY